VWPHIDLFAVIDWMMRLPKVLSEQLWQNLDNLEQEKKVAYVLWPPGRNCLNSSGLNVRFLPRPSSSNYAAEGIRAINVMAFVDPTQERLWRSRNSVSACVARVYLIPTRATSIARGIAQTLIAVWPARSPAKPHGWPNPRTWQLGSDPN